MYKNTILLFGALIMISCSSESIKNSDYFDFKNQKIYFENYGDKKNPDVLFIHGLMGSSTSFDDIITELIKKYHVTAIDLPGHGKSNLSINFTITELSNVVEMFIEDKFDEEFSIVGYSLGGTITNDLLSKNLDNINSAVLIDPWFSNNSTIDLATFKLLGFVEKREKNNWVNYEDSEKYVLNMNPNLSKKQNESISKNRFEYNINVWDSNIQKGTLIKKSSTPIETPTILIKPESSLVRESQIEKLKNNYLNFKINEIPNTSHMVIFESSREVSNLISNHIE
tara:strand:- start:147 stop:995 length:849 start_codon:yes stop_codon:yes gene_type:complete